MNILLVRHGETAWNRAGRYQGRTDVPLSVDGEAQVGRLAARLASVPIDVAVASPLSRARRTAEAVLAAPGRARPPELLLDDGLIEISHGGWESKLASEVELSDAEMLHTWRHRPDREVPAGPGAETLGDVELRAWSAMDRLAVKIGHGTALVAAHDAVNRVILCKVLGLPLARVWTFQQAPAALNVLAGNTLETLQVVRLNDFDHVGPLLAHLVHQAL
jgi:broad specificity phosphatase PhoE